MTTHVWLVGHSCDYEGSDVTQVFLTKEKALDRLKANWVVQQGWAYSVPIAPEPIEWRANAFTIINGSITYFAYQVEVDE